MKKKILLPAFMAIMMVVSLISPQFSGLVSADISNVAPPSADSGTTPPTETTTEPVIVIGTPSYEIKSGTTPVVKAGTTSNISFVIINTGGIAVASYATISDTKEVITFPGVTEFEETTIVGTNGMSINTVITVPAHIPSGLYNLTLKITATNLDYVKNVQTLEVPINIQGSLKLNALDVIEYSIDKPDVRKDDKFNLTVKLKNNTGLDLTNAKFTLDGLDGTKFGMNGGLSTVILNMKKDEETTIRFSLIGCAGIASTREILPLKISYFLDPSNKETLQESTMNVTVPCVKLAEDDPNAKIFAPNIIIDKYNFGGNFVVGGKTFPLSLTLHNASKTTAIENLKVTIQGAAGTGENGIAYSPANSSNSFFFESIPAGGTTDINLDLISKATAVPDSYPVQVICNYEYTSNGKKDKAETVTETISIPLQQDDRLTANQVDIQQESYVNQECQINASLVNKGKSAVYNVTVDVVGTGFEKTGSAYYIGNIESGKEEYYDTQIIPGAIGELKGEVVITYEDANGKSKEIRKEFVTAVMDMPVMDPNGGGMEIGKPVDGNVDGENGGLPVWAIVLICVGGAAVVLVVVLIVVKTIKKKKLKAAENEDDNEDI